jgi:hypothetical protein
VSAGPLGDNSSVDPSRQSETSLSQKMFCNNSSGNLDRGGAYPGTLDDTVPTFLY